MDLKKAGAGWCEQNEKNLLHGNAGKMTTIEAKTGNLSEESAKHGAWPKVWKHGGIRGINIEFRESANYVCSENTNKIFVMRSKLVILLLRRNSESCECVSSNNYINRKVFSICFVFSFQFFLTTVMHIIRQVSLIFRYCAEILLENALFCWQNARLKNRLFYSKFCRQNLSKPTI